MRSLISILLFMVISALASGIPQALHQHEHDLEDAREALAAAQSHDSPKPHNHDDCPICEQFRAPLFFSNNVVLIIDAGIWIPFLSMLPIDQHSQTSPSQISCRGPPSPPSIA